MSFSYWQNLRESNALDRCFESNPAVPAYVDGSVDVAIVRVSDGATLLHTIMRVLAKIFSSAVTKSHESFACRSEVMPELVSAVLRMSNTKTDTVLVASDKLARMTRESARAVCSHVYCMHR